MCLHKFVAGCRGMARRRVIQLQSPWLLAYYCTGEGRGKRTKQAVCGENGKFLKHNHRFLIYNFYVQHIPVSVLVKHQEKGVGQ
uniref:Uncharacterized protein n=1 Tax=Leersia perrieri TaxID=77586 RepID=A0A0D9Y1F3_9ORYZ